MPGSPPPPSTLVAAAAANLGSERLGSASHGKEEESWTKGRTKERKAIRPEKARRRRVKKGRKERGGREGRKAERTNKEKRKKANKQTTKINLHKAKKISTHNKNT